MPIETTNDKNGWGILNANSNSWGSNSENKIENQINAGWSSNQSENNVPNSSGWNLEEANNPS